MEPTWKPHRGTTYHRKDGTVSYWSVYKQCWVRQLASHIPAREIAAMSDEQRKNLPACAGLCE